MDDKEEKEEHKRLEKEYKDLSEWWREQIKSVDRLAQEVRVTTRLTTTPCIVVSAKFGWSAHMEKIMMAQALGDPERQQYMRSQKILEINPLHPMVSYIKGRFDQDREDADAKLLAQLMYDTALLGERPTALGSAGCRCRVVASRALQWQALLSHMKAPLHQRGF